VSPQPVSRRLPLHPRLVHTPIGAVVAAALLDTISLIGRHHLWAHDLYRTSTFVLILGQVMLALAVIAGYIDRARNTRRGSLQRKAVNSHATVMIVLGTLCAAEIILRREHYGAAQGHTPVAMVALSIAALVVATIGGELGGRLVYQDSVGVGEALPVPTGVDSVPSELPRVSRSTP
jgi:uncharacterized membrane protein